MTAGTPERDYMPVVSDDLPDGERPMIAIVHARPGHEEALAQAISILAAAVRQEPECKEFRPFRDLANPGTFYLYEIYHSTEAFRVHLATAHVAAFFTQLAAHSSSDAQALTQLLELPLE